MVDVVFGISDFTLVVFNSCNGKRMSNIFYLLCHSGNLFYLADWNLNNGSLEMIKNVREATVWETEVEAQAILDELHKWKIADSKYLTIVPGEWAKC